MLYEAGFENLLTSPGKRTALSDTCRQRGVANMGICVVVPVRSKVSLLDQIPATVANFMTSYTNALQVLQKFRL